MSGRWKKLSPVVVAEIRLRVAAGGVEQTSLAREYGVSDGTIRYHLHGKMHADPLAEALNSAANARKSGQLTDAARFLRTAADILEGRKAA